MSFSKSKNNFFKKDLFFKNSMLNCRKVQIYTTFLNWILVKNRVRVLFNSYVHHIYVWVNDSANTVNLDTEPKYFL